MSVFSSSASAAGETDTTAKGVQRWAVVAVVGQAVFPLSWLVAGGIDSGYSHEREYVSELAARNAAHPWIVDVGIVALGLSWIAIGLALRGALPKRPWSWVPPALFLAIGIGTTLEAVLPLDCAASVDHACSVRRDGWDLSWRHYAHEFIGWPVQAMLAATPFALARTLRPGTLARLALAFGLIGLALGAGQVAANFVDEPRAGIYQRAGLIVAAGWTYLLATALLLAAAVRPPGFGVRERNA